MCCLLVKFGDFVAARFIGKLFEDILVTQSATVDSMRSTYLAPLICDVPKQEMSTLI